MHTSSIYNNGQYLKNNPTWHEEDSLWKANHIAKIICKNGLKPTTVCEIGSGAGGVLWHLSQMNDVGNEFVGYEMSEQALSMSRNRSKANLKYFPQDALTGDSPYYDIVLIIDVLEHVEDCFSFLRQVKMRGKYKIFHIPLEISVRAVIKPSQIIEFRKQFGHIHNFSKDTALDRLVVSGYDIIDYIYTESAMVHAGGGWKAFVLNGARKMLFKMDRDVAVKVLGGYSLMVLAK